MATGIWTCKYVDGQITRTVFVAANDYNTGGQNGYLRVKDAQGLTFIVHGSELSLITCL